MQLRVLHVVTAMNRGGLEVWLMHLLRNIDHSHYSMDFLVQVTYEGAFDREIRDQGSKVISCPRGRNLLAFAMSFVKAIRKHGPYDIVHSHVHHFSGVVALLSRLAGVRAVIAHSHNTDYGDRSKLPLPVRSYLALMEMLIRSFADFGLACSKEAGLDLFQSDWYRTQNHRVLHCGLDFSRFERGNFLPPFPSSASAKSLVHVGRFTPQKNQTFLVDVVKALVQMRTDFKLLLIGTGELAAGVQEKAMLNGLAEVIQLLGDRDDVPDILMDCDVFLFPSIYEGLGLALVEAQAAGLRCVVSDAVPQEAVIVPHAVRYLPLSVGPAAWASVIDAALDASKLSRPEALQLVLASSFNLPNCIDDLCALYDDIGKRPK